MENQKSFEICGSLESEECADIDNIDNIDNIEEVEYWILDIEHDISSFLDENEIIIKDLKKEIENIPKDLYEKCFEKHNYNEHKIMLEVAQALQERAHHDKNYNDFQRWYKCINFLKIIITKDEIDFNNDIFKQYASIFEKIYLLGYFHGCKEALEIDSVFYEDIYEDHFHKKKSSDYVQKRHAKDKKLYDKAIAHAKSLWDKGSELMHHEMARNIHKKALFSGLSLDSLREQLKPVSKPYGKFYNPNEKSKKKCFFS